MCSDFADNLKGWNVSRKFTDRDILFTVYFEIIRRIEKRFGQRFSSLSAKSYPNNDENGAIIGTSEEINNAK